MRRRKLNLRLYLRATRHITSRRLSEGHQVTSPQSAARCPRGTAPGQDEETRRIDENVFLGFVDIAEALGNPGLANYLTSFAICRLKVTTDTTNNFCHCNKYKERG